MPQVDIAKVIAITEQALLARAPAPRDFAKLYENDIEFRKQWQTITEAKHLLALGKGMASLTPTSVEVGSSQTSDDSAEAIKQLNEMAVKNGQSFEQVFAHPDNRKLAMRRIHNAIRTGIARRLTSEFKFRDAKGKTGRGFSFPPVGPHREGSGSGAQQVPCSDPTISRAVSSSPLARFRRRVPRQQGNPVSSRVRPRWRAHHSGKRAAIPLHHSEKSPGQRREPVQRVHPPASPLVPAPVGR